VVTLFVASDGITTQVKTRPGHPSVGRHDGDGYGHRYERRNARVCHVGLWAVRKKN